MVYPHEKLPRSPKNHVGLNSLNPLFLTNANGSISLFRHGITATFGNNGILSYLWMLWYLKIREEGRVRSRSALIDIGINETGFREILGLMLGDSESETSWTELFTWLKKRHFRGVNIVVSDSHGGLVRAVRNQFQGTTWQNCQNHFMQNILDVTPKSIQTEIHSLVRTLFTAPDMETTRLLLKKII